MKFIAPIIVVALVAYLAVTSFNRSSAPTPAAPAPTTAQSESESENSPTVKEIIVKGSDFRFDPASITVNRGDRVKIIFQNTDGFHDFKLDEFDLATPTLRAGEEAVLEFTASQAGQFEYYCSVGNHRQMGMVGTLIVQ